MPHPSNIASALFIVEDLLSYILNLYGFTWFPSRIHHQTLRWELSQYVFLPYLGQLLIGIGNAYEEELDESVYDIFIPVMSHPQSERSRVLLSTIINQLPCDFESDEWIDDLFLYMAILVELAVHFFLSGRYRLFDTTLFAVAVIIGSQIPEGFLAGLAAIRNFVRRTIVDHTINETRIL